MGTISKTTGLTPQQEKAVVLLATGHNMTSTAKQLNIERSTLYQWGAKDGFKAYFNTLISEIQENTKNSLFGLLDEALETLKNSLKSKNESVKLKAALCIIDRVKDVEVGQTDPIKMIREKCTHTFDGFEVDYFKEAFDEVRFEKLVLDNNLGD